MQAILVVVAAALMALLLPPLSYLSGAAVALVTLRMGMQQGLLLILWAVLAVSLGGVLLVQNPIAGGVFAVALWLPVWAMAVSLRRTGSPARSLVLATSYGLMAVLAFHLSMDEPVQWWFRLLQDGLQETLAQLAEAERQQLLRNLQVIAGLMTGVSAAVLSATLIGCLLLGRWWQAVLFNPGGFGSEFRQLRLGRPLTLGAVLLIGLMSLAESALLYQDMFVVLLVPFALQGLAVVHALVKLRQAQKGWLVALYVLLFVATGQMALVLAFVGTVDNWFDFRKFFGPKSGGADEI
ncbi:MAG: DUF2232 domain-containing protein [Gammaproteobacteria bacterium]|nr:DUF2232 domain-containing protein [Gammaproteobacteria bacterium]